MSTRVVNAAKALKSINVETSAIQNLSKHPKTRNLLIKWGVDPDCYYPVMMLYISEEQWLKLIIFYARMAHYQPAIDFLKNAIDKVKDDLFK
jgi:hypothetical protein